MSMPIHYVLVILVVFASHDGVLRFVQASEGENRLVQYLFSEQGYNPLVRPTQHSNETVVVSFGLLLVQLIHVTISKPEEKDIQTYLFFEIVLRFTKKSKL
jgi:hypothetical protein